MKRFLRKTNFKSAFLLSLVMTFGLFGCDQGPAAPGKLDLLKPAQGETTLPPDQNTQEPPIAPLNNSTSHHGPTATAFPNGSQTQSNGAQSFTLSPLSGISLVSATQEIDRAKVILNNGVANPLRTSTPALSPASAVSLVSQGRGIDLAKVISGNNPPSSPPASWTTSDPKGIDGLILKVKTIDLSNDTISGGTNSPIEFELASDPSFSGSRVFRAIFEPEVLKKGKLATIDFSETGQSAHFQVVSAIKVSDLDERYKYFKFFSKGDDLWGLGGVELQIKKNGDQDYTTIYRNPCVNRWIAKWGTPKGAYYSASATPFVFDSSEHGPEDEAYCVAQKTCDQEDAGTEDHITMRIPHVTDNQFTAIPFNWSFGIPLVTYDDFQRNHESLYGASFYRSLDQQLSGGLDEKFQLYIDGTDRWQMCGLQVYHIKPADTSFIQQQSCLSDNIKAHAGNPIYLTTDINECNFSSCNIYPREYRTLHQGTCTGMEDISWAGEKKPPQFMKDKF